MAESENGNKVGPGRPPLRIRLKKGGVATPAAVLAPAPPRARPRDQVRIAIFGRRQQPHRLAPARNVPILKI
jgi:hypothetical protein